MLLPDSPGPGWLGTGERFEVAAYLLRPWLADVKLTPDTADRGDAAGGDLAGEDPVRLRVRAGPVGTRIGCSG